MKTKYILALCLLWGAVSCTEVYVEPETDTDMQTPEDGQEDDTPDAPKRLTLELTLDNYENVGNTPVVTPTTRSVEEIRDRYYNSVHRFEPGNQVGLFTQGGNLDSTVADNIFAGFFNVPLTCTSGSNFSSEELNANETDFKHRFVYYPYAEAAYTAKGFPIRNEDGSAIDLLIASKKTSTGGMTFKHAFAVLEITRGYMFDKPTLPTNTELLKAAPKAAQEDAEYMQVELEAPVINMRFYPQVENYWTYTLAANNGVADYQFVGTAEEITVAGLEAGADYEEDVNYAIFDRFKKYAEATTNTGASYGILLPTVDNEVCGTKYISGGTIPDYGTQRGGSHSQIKSISLWDNDGIWRTITDIQMIEHDGGKFEGKRLYGNTAYPMTVRMEANGAKIFPVMVGRWEDGGTKYGASVNGIASLQDFENFNARYNSFLDTYGDYDNRSRDLTEKDITDFINGGNDDNSGFGRATIERDESDNSIKNVRFTFLVTAPLDLSAASSQSGSLIHRLDKNDTFDGGGYEISGIDITVTESNPLPGFVGRCDGTLKNVNLETFHLAHDSEVPTGIFCAELGEYGSVQGCTARNASVSAPNSTCGAIAGKVTGGGSEEAPQIVGNTVISSIMQGKQNDVDANKLWGEKSGTPTQKNNRIDVEIINTLSN